MKEGEGMKEEGRKEGRKKTCLEGGVSSSESELQDNKLGQPK